MRAAVCRQFGPPESISVEDYYPAPALSDGSSVRVRVEAAAVNFPDVLFMANQYQLTIPVPFIPGSEFAGVITEVGDGISGFAIGDRVMGTTMVGAFAEEVVVAARSLSPIPDGVSAETAAAFGVAHRTAYHALRTIAEVTPGERLVVLGAGGGVGLAAVQLGVVLGLDVTAVASSDEKLAVAASYGASRGINHRAFKDTAGDVRKALKDAFPDGTDVVIDPVGGDLAEPALRSLRWAGRFVSIGYAAGSIPKIPLNLVMLKGCKILGFQMRDLSANVPDAVRRDEAELRELLAAGKVTPHVGASFELSAAAAALRQVADGKAIGKVVLSVG
ncbi:MAG TPA: NADPH:quinone oxidoreductase family protein [Trebonia sp.]|jgi:NADPH2:quinone reductase|nr:NADPH:quinone oxidoreductase family protein [Trebonia sp.]